MTTSVAVLAFIIALFIFAVFVGLALKAQEHCDYWREENDRIRKMYRD